MQHWLFGTCTAVVPDKPPSPTPSATTIWCRQSPTSLRWDSLVYAILARAGSSLLLIACGYAWVCDFGLEDKVLIRRKDKFPVEGQVMDTLDMCPVQN